MRKRLAPWLTCSLAFSIAAFIAPSVGALIRVHGLAAVNLSFDVSFAFSAAWLLVLIIALYVHRQRGLWLLFGLPTAIFWPAFFLLWIEEMSRCAVQPHGCDF